MANDSKTEKAEGLFSLAFCFDLSHACRTAALHRKTPRRHGQFGDRQCCCGSHCFIALPQEADNAASQGSKMEAEALDAPSGAKESMTLHHGPLMFKEYETWAWELEQEVLEKAIFLTFGLAMQIFAMLPGKACPCQDRGCAKHFNQEVC